MSPLATLRLYAETLRHLKPVQIHGRARFAMTRPRPDERPAPPLRRMARTFAAPARRRPSLVGPAEFRLLNQTRRLDECGWEAPEASRLWRYNLHYFDDCNAEEPSGRASWHRALVDRWVAENRPGRGTGWEPYPTSLRIVNWIKWSLAGNRLGGQALSSLAVQARWLERRLERHLPGNHLLANGKALVFAGLFFEGEEAARWLGTGAGILARELEEQILPDGGHFELSPMYHALVLEDLLDVVNLGKAAAARDFAATRNLLAALPAKIQAMRAWLRAMCHPDGEIGFFNDAAIGVAPSPAELEAYAARLALPPLSEPRSGLTRLVESGYARLESAGLAAIVDVASVGPDHLPGHAHADTLAFELSVGNCRVLVNSGTSLYEAGPERRRQRGTAAHNTVIVEGEDSSQVWASFRVARRAHPVVTTAVDGDPVMLAASHDGYRRLPGRPIHRRRWHLGRGGLEVFDELVPAARGVANFHFHPQAAILAGSEAGAGGLMTAEGTILCWQVADGEPRLEPASFHREFGMSEPTRRLAVALRGGRSAVRFFVASGGSA